MKKSEFLSLVKEEADNIKKHATSKEIDRLDFDLLDPNRAHMCVYGQMTGHCRNIRALTLINECCPIIFDVVTSDDFGDKMNGNNVLKDKSFSSVKQYINGSTKEHPITGELYTAFDRMSMIEGYILLKGAKNKNLIDYIKGHSEKLVL